MRILKRIITLLFITIFCLQLVMSAQAADIDKNNSVSLTVIYKDGNTAISGAEFEIYLIATVNEKGKITETDAFKGYKLNIADREVSEWANTALTLQGYVQRDKTLPSDSGKTGADGAIKFPTAGKTLKQGLYLVLNKQHKQNGYIYTSEPFITMLPGHTDDVNVWNYDITAYPKYDKDKEPSKPDETEYSVVKVWKDTGYENSRPKEITVQIMKNGKVYTTVKLSKDNNWRYSWKDSEGGNQWTVAENSVSGYTAEVTKNGTSFYITNTYRPNIPPNTPPDNPPDNPPNTPPDNPPNTPPETPPTTTIPPIDQYEDPPDDPRLPQTGLLWWPVPVLLVSGLIFIACGLFIRKMDENEE